MSEESEDRASEEYVDMDAFKLELSRKLAGLIQHPGASKETKEELSKAVSELLE